MESIPETVFTSVSAFSSVYTTNSGVGNDG